MSQNYAFQAVYISHLKAITRVSDPVHGTISLTCFDREVVDSAYFQRLHFVLQNSTTYAAYPANKNSRFIHSLGVADLCGKIFTTAVNASGSRCLLGFLRDFVSFFETEFAQPRAVGGEDESYRKKVVQGWHETIEGRSGFAHSPYVKGIALQSANAISPTLKIENPSNKEGTQFEAMFCIDTIWQALRICGLAHDIGHLPMSHSFEMALDRCPILFELFDDIGENSKSSQRALAVEFSDALDSDETVAGLRGSTNQNDAIDGFEKEYLKNAAAQVKHVARIYGHSEEEVRDFLSYLPVHERRSLYILAAIDKENKFDLADDSPANKYRSMIYWMAFFILYSSLLDQFVGNRQNPDINKEAQTCDFGRHSFLRVLKSIVAGELDADRLDYTVRDGLACGSTIGSFDIQNLVSNAILVSYEGGYYVAMYEKAIPEIERFFTQRRDSYKYLIYHKTSSRSEACLRELIARVIHYAFLFNDSKVAQVLIEHRYLKVNKKGKIVRILPLDDFALKAQDDTSLRSALFQIRQHMLTLDHEEGENEGNIRYCGPIRSLCDIVLIREFQDIHSPYKKLSISKSLLRDFGNEITQEGLKEATQTLFQGSLWEEYEKKFRVQMAKKFPEVITIVNLKFPKTFRVTPKQQADRVLVIDDEATLHNIAHKSSTLRQLASEDSGKLEVDVYFVSDGLRKNRRKIQCLEEEASKALRTLYLEVCDKNI